MKNLKLSDISNIQNLRKTINGVEIYNLNKQQFKEISDELFVKIIQTNGQVEAKELFEYVYKLALYNTDVDLEDTTQEDLFELLESDDVSVELIEIFEELNDIVFTCVSSSFKKVRQVLETQELLEGIEDKIILLKDINTDEEVKETTTEVIKKKISDFK